MNGGGELLKLTSFLIWRVSESCVAGHCAAPTIFPLSPKNMM